MMQLMQELHAKLLLPIIKSSERGLLDARNRLDISLSSKKEGGGIQDYTIIRLSPCVGRVGYHLTCQGH